MIPWYAVMAYVCVCASVCAFVYLPWVSVEQAFLHLRHM